MTAVTHIMSADLSRLRFRGCTAILLVALTLVLLASCADGQESADLTTPRARRGKAIPSANSTASIRSAEGASSKIVKPLPVPTQSNAVAADAVNKTPPSVQKKPRSAESKVANSSSIAEDRDNEEDQQPEQDEEAEHGQSDDDATPIPIATRPPPASIVTPPLPGVPLSTVFAAADEPTEAPCVAIKAGIRFTFSYTNVSSGKVEQGVFDLPARNYSIDGDCGTMRQRMSLIFSPDRKVSPESAVEAGTAWNLTLTFVRNGSEIFGDRVSLRYVVQTGHLPFPWSIDAAVTAVLLKPGLFRTPDEEHSFICMSDAGYDNFVIVADNVTASGLGGTPAPSSDDALSKSSDSSQPLKADDGQLNVNQSVRLQMIEFYNLQLQAFLKPPPPSSSSEAGSKVTTVTFSSRVVQCSGDYISVKVPFVLGVILLVFVVAVVTVYMIRRLKHGKQEDMKRKSVDYRAVH